MVEAQWKPLTFSHVTMEKWMLKMMEHDEMAELII